MDESEIKRRYDTERRRYEEYTLEIEALLKKLTKEADIPIAHIESRVKGWCSFLRKCREEGYDDPFEQLKDIVGARIVTCYVDDADRVADIVREEFEVDTDHSEDKRAELLPNEFGYLSIHLVVTLGESRRSLPEWKDFAGLSAEIQIRSVLQHGWASISRQLDYRQASDAPRALRRRLFRLSALLEVADDEFSSLRDARTQIANEYGGRLAEGDLDIPLNLDSLTEFLSLKVNNEHWEKLATAAGIPPYNWTPTCEYNIEATSRLLCVLRAIGMSRIGDFDELLTAIKPRAQEKLREFASLQEQSGVEFWTIALEILAALVYLFNCKNLPKGFAWEPGFRPDVEQTLKDMCREDA